MHLTGTPSATNSLPHVWTLLIDLFPRYYVVTSMLFLTEPKIVGALILLSPSVRALSHWGYSDVWRHLHPDLHAYTWLKPDGSFPPPPSILLASCLPGFILCFPVLLFNILSLITMPFFSASLSLNLFLVALADGN